MNDPWLEKWNKRYCAETFAYGEQANLFLKEQLANLPPGNILFPAEGEGRNAVFAAQLGWNVSAFDISIEGQRKARILAAKNKVSIDYRLGELHELDYRDKRFDVLALIYAHFPPVIKSRMHKALDQLVIKGGLVIFEAFSKNHLDYLALDERVGGPRDLDSLFSVDEISADFDNYDILELREEEIELHEGLFHNGLGSVIRFVGQKR